MLILHNLFQILKTTLYYKTAVAAAAAKSLQSCPTLARPHRWQPNRLPRPWDSPGKNTGVGSSLSSPLFFLFNWLLKQSQSVK